MRDEAGVGAGGVVACGVAVCGVAVCGLAACGVDLKLFMIASRWYYTPAAQRIRPPIPSMVMSEMPLAPD